MISRRRDAEEENWNAIDVIQDGNKYVLAEHIDKGLKNKAELTKFMRKLAALNLERSNKAKDLQEKKNQLENKMVEQQKKRSDIAAQEEMYQARIQTIEEKDI